MKKKNSLKRNPIKLDLDRIEIDVLSDSMQNGLQGGYQTQPGHASCMDGNCNTSSGCTFGCPTQAYTCTDPYVCC
jgi:hypothetical protein